MCCHCLKRKIKPMHCHHLEKTKRKWMMKPMQCHRLKIKIKEKKERTQVSNDAELSSLGARGFRTIVAYWRNDRRVSRSCWQMASMEAMTVDARCELGPLGLEFCQSVLHCFLLLPPVVVKTLELGLSGGDISFSCREFLLKALDFFGYFVSCSLQLL